jgi:hypothetical protein
MLYSVYRPAAFGQLITRRWASCFATFDFKVSAGIPLLHVSPGRQRGPSTSEHFLNAVASSEMVRVTGGERLLSVH